MSTQPLNVRLEDTIIKKAKELANKLGIPFSGLISGLLKQAIRDKKIELSLLTSNGFTEDFEDQVVESLNSSEGDISLNSPEDIKKYFNQIEN